MKFDIDNLARSLQKACPRAVFALLHGSAKNGEIRQGSDLDIAVYLDEKPDLEIYQILSEAVEKAVNSARPDIGFLNGAEPVYRFEALTGKLLFCRDRESYVSFFSLTCREYESQLADYGRQRQYRLEYNS